ncbi:putative pentatricopeptide repeat-containing protein At3g01580 [Zingiber officinale]|uniref:putative pentatricopeptide repeat-containing protein At3g01580 n=1 Tax=Zingiber officinale TaxID=94328 RepID=UPI001C4D501A|nr:putative pentatricopeptide repeat-containing protein At3g01580 [Zingiber officinale]
MLPCNALLVSFFSSSPLPAPSNPARSLVLFRAELLRLFPLCSSLFSVKKLHARFVVAGLLKDSTFAIETIRKYLLFDQPRLALPVFEAAENSSLYLQNLVLRCLSDNGFHRDLLSFYSQKQHSRRRLRSDEFTFPFVIKACTAVSNTRMGKEVHCVVLRSGYGANLVVQTALVDMYAKTGCVKLSRRVFDEMPDRDLISWNALLSGYSSNGLERESFEAFRQMQAEGWKPNSSTFLGIIPLCRSYETPKAGELIHALALKYGAFSGEALVPTLISMYAGFENLAAARLLFESLPSKDHVAWNAMISAYSQNDKWEESLQVFRLMHHSNEKPNSVTLISVLAACTNFCATCHGECIHAIGIQSGIADKVLVTAALVSMYARHGKIDSAEYLFYFSPLKSLLLWNSLISGYLSNGLSNKGLSAFHDMLFDNAFPDSISIINAISGCTMSKDLCRGKSAHAYIIRNGFDSNTKVMNALLALYCDCGQLSTSLKLFYRIHARSVISWNTLIGGFSKTGDTESCITLFHMMGQEGVRFDLVTLIGIVSSFYIAEDAACGMFFHSLAIKTGCSSDTSLTNALMSMYMSFSEVEAANTLFHTLSSKDVVTWNTLITGYRNVNLFEEVMLLFEQMNIYSQRPNSVTFLNVLPACHSLLQGKSIHAYAIRNFSDIESTLHTATMMMHARFENYHYCRLLFETIDKTNVVAWNTIMSVYIQANHAEAAICSFRNMLLMQLKPDTVTMLNLASASAQIGSLDLAQCVTSIAIHMGLDSHTTIVNCLINMFARCGSVMIARELFDGLKEKDSITWSVMINGYGIHGDGKAALGLFSEMKEAGLEPDDITFMSLLSACSHAGLVEQARTYFKSMIEHHGITPRMEHYACIIDLFGRTGHLDEAYDVVKNLPFEPSASLLESLLGACQSHGNAEIGEAIGKLLIDAIPYKPTPYVMLSNIYAAAGQWIDYGMVRWEMELKRIKKEAGVSLVEII